LKSSGQKTSRFASEDFTEILRWRLGLAPEVEQTMCHNATGEGKVCAEVLNAFLDRAMCCSNGPLRIQRRDNIPVCLADIIEDTGAHFRRESYMKVFRTLG